MYQMLSIRHLDHFTITVIHVAMTKGHQADVDRNLVLAAELEVFSCSQETVYLKPTYGRHVPMAFRKRILTVICAQPEPSVVKYALAVPR